MKYKVIEDLCIGCGTCYNINDELFAFNDSGRAIVVKQPTTEEEIESANNAIEYCPTNAIVNGESNEHNCANCPGCH